MLISYEHDQGTAYARCYMCLYTEVTLYIYQINRKLLKHEITKPIGEIPTLVRTSLLRTYPDTSTRIQSYTWIS